MKEKEYLKMYIKEKVSILPSKKNYTEQKIDALAQHLLDTNRSIEELTKRIDEKFLSQSYEEEHQKQKTSLQECYKSSMNKIKSPNTNYLLSYKEGIKVLEQAEITTIEEINKLQKRVKLNREKKGLQKEYNPYELIISDLAYLLDIPYADTYHILDGSLQSVGILSIEEQEGIYLTLEETLKFIQEESPKFGEKYYLLDYHDKRIKKGTREIFDTKEYRENIEYIFRLFASLPDITKENLTQLRKEYIEYLILQIVANNINVNLSTLGIGIKKDKKRYHYFLTTIYSKTTPSYPRVKPTQMICNFYIVDKKECIHRIMASYYKECRDLVTLIETNKETLLKLIDQVAKEHLSYKEYKEYMKQVRENIILLGKELFLKKQVSEDTKEDKKRYEEKTQVYREKISPFIDDYIVEEKDNKGSVILSLVISFVLLGTIIAIFFVIYAVSKMDI